jgi:transposase
MRLLSLDQWLPADHRARLVWTYVKGLNLDSYYRELEVTANSPGRSAIAPEILVALWLLATLEGIGSGRELARRCKRDIGYLWILGGVTVNYHSLSDFRVRPDVEKLLIDTVAVLVHQELVPLDTIAQDGMRVRASAGSSSFRRKPTLEKLQAEAQQHVTSLREKAEKDDAGEDGRSKQQAAAERAARERQERIDEALRQHEELSQRREKRKAGDGEKTRVSTTDPDARVMKMANGGYDPAFNVQFATDAESRIIVAVEVTNAGTDAGELPPMLEKIQKQYGRTPSEALVDSAYATHDSVTTAFQQGVNVISTVPRASELEQNGKDPHARQPRDTDEYAAFRACMADPECQALYKTRPSIAEFPNADCRNRNLRQFRVRGLLKVKAVAIWHALAFNFMRLINLGFGELQKT